MDRLVSTIVGFIALVIVVGAAHPLGKWVGMNLVGLPEPNGADNFFAAVLGLCIMVIIVAVIALARFIGELIRDY